ncbi:MAG: hypothetical protein K2O66_03785 [Bacteroidales bacterium]|nr:hypothetical protein [Bacteroidales bacterium]MDE7072471.1 hypothetical protein [Bacteroidales bacterium]
MYKVLKARIIKDGKAVREYDMNAETDDLESIRANVLKQYSQDCASEVGVDLQYKALK